jgi:hypothetical protein
MNNKRILVIPVVALLAVIITVAASLAFTRSSGSTQLIPVTGLSNSGGSQPYQLIRQEQALNNKVNSKWIPGQENIQDKQPLPTYVDGKAQWRNSVEEFIRGQQNAGR